MSREVRRVPENWEHPTNERGHKPLLGWAFSEDRDQWIEESKQWENGLESDFHGGWEPISGCHQGMTYADYAGEPPEPKDYMPEWDESELTHIMMYETCTEGTPISPAFKTPEELARWLAENDASAFGSQTATYEQWLAVCREGWAPSAVIDDNGLRSGVAATSDL